MDDWQRHIELQESERRLKNAMRLARIGYYIWDFEKDRNIYCTKEFAALHGTTVDDYMSSVQTMEDDVAMIHPDDREAYATAFARRREEHHPLTLEYRIIGKDGVTRHVREVETAPEWIDDAPTLMEGTLQDITDFKQLERELRESEATYRGILENLEDTYYRTDSEGRIVMVSPSCHALLGYTPEELTGVPLRDLYVNPADRSAFLETLRQTGGRVRGYSAWLRHKNGNCIRVEAHSRFTLDDKGIAFGVEGAARNVTERWRAEEMNARLGRIIESSVNEIYVLSEPDFKFISVNRSARKNLGYQMDELQGMTPLDIAPEFSQGELVELIKPLRQGQTEVVTFATNHFRKDGSSYPVDIRLQAVRSETPPIYFAVVEDVTQRKKTEAQLFQARKLEAIGNLTGGVAHDFNNLLAVILGNLELISEGGQAEEIARYADAAIKAANRGAELTRNMLSFARQSRLEPKVLDLNHLVREVETWSARVIPANISLDVQLLDDLWRVEADPALAQNALLNLTLNSRDAMPEGGKLTIRTDNLSIRDAQPALKSEGLSPGDYVVLSVSDTGEGIPPENIPKIFDPFFTTKPAGSGSGLGLSMIQGFMNQSGGTVRVRSEPDAGTNIELIFRALDKDREEPQPTTPEVRSVPTADARILVVEDEPAVLDVLLRSLSRAGYRVGSAVSGDEAVKLWELDSEFDLVITDIVMPGRLQGTHLAQVLREQAPSLPVIFMSGYARDTAAQQDAVRPQDIRLMKPVSRTDLLVSVENALGVARKRHRPLPE